MGERSLGLKESQLIRGQGHQEPLLNTEADITHHLTFQAREEEDASHYAVPVSTGLIKQIANKAGGRKDKPHDVLGDFCGAAAVSTSAAAATATSAPWPYVSKDADRSTLEPVAQWDSPMQVKLSCWKAGLNTLLVELLPWALLVNHSRWDLWLFEGETIVLQIPAGKVIVPPNFQLGIYWAHTNTVHKSTALKLVHEQTSPRWKEGGVADVVTLDEEGCVEADVTLGASPGRQKLCQFCVSSVVRQGVQVLLVEDRTILLNNTGHTVHYRPLLFDHALAPADQVFTAGCLSPKEEDRKRSSEVKRMGRDIIMRACPGILFALSCQSHVHECEPEKTVLGERRGEALHLPDSVAFTLPPAAVGGGGGSQATPCSVPCWDQLLDKPRGEVDSPLPLRHMLFSLDPGALEAGTGTGASWSLPALIRADFPRQSISVPVEAVAGGGGSQSSSVAGATPDVNDRRRGTGERRESRRGRDRKRKGVEGKDDDEMEARESQVARTGMRSEPHNERTAGKQ
ncbi:hypothetical protein CRUP_037117 [Coryphaenoides rupestris]|nr:hypothetical protein CRUP_037117 [Coryphaenoides rupestris]